MNTNAQDIAKGILEAMKSEVDGYNFYMMASKSTQDPQGKIVFERLAKEEMEHVQFLKLQYKAVIETGNIAPDKHLTKTAFTSISPIFSDSIKDRVKDAHYEMTALSVGIQLELSAIQFYKEQENKVNDPGIKSFYRELADWETTHYQVLLKQQNDLKEDYWSQGDFAPF